MMQQVRSGIEPRIPVAASARELTLRGLALGAVITVMFTASNVYLGLKIGLTFASSIPAAVISMAVLRLLARGDGGGAILENNMVQTQASAAGTLSSVIFVIPGLVMTGAWHGFPYLPTAAVCLAGGMLGVLFTIPLRRALVTGSSLPYPEGVAAAEILRVGEGAAVGGDLRRLLAGGIGAAGFALLVGGLKLFSDGAAVTLSAGAAVFRLSTGFSLALVGAGYLVGIGGGLAMLLGAVLSWGVAVPVLTALTPHPAGVGLADFATSVWSHKVRFIGAGTIGVAAIWTLLGLIGPVARGLRESFALGGAASAGGADRPRTDRDLPPVAIVGLGLALLLCLFAVFAGFLRSPTGAIGPVLATAFACMLFCALFGFLVAAACGYMAGIVGSSASPISGIAIVATVLISLLVLALSASGVAPAGFAAPGRGLAIAAVLFVTSAVLASATISNDNLQDLKTGQLVGATPWRQQVALLAGCVAGAAVIPPVLNLLYRAYGFAGALPRAGMDAGQALAAPQATLMSTIARGIFLHQLDWTMIVIGLLLGVVLILVSALLERRGLRLPVLAVLAVGIGLYLPPTVSVTLVIGAVLSWATDRTTRDREDTRRRGTMLASGFIVGESLMGVALAGVIGTTGNEDALALAGPGFARTAAWLGFAAFILVCALFCRLVTAAPTGNLPDAGV